jgi:D-inositol-3-phosphate glycosyltransferase
VQAADGGLHTAVRDGYSGVLVDSREPAAYARELEQLIASPGRLAQLSRGAIEHASAFGWPATADQLIGVYTDAMNAMTAMDQAAATVRA